jgi:hypothetical protein
MKKIMIILVAFMLVAPMAFAQTYTVSAGGELTSGSGDKDPSVVLSVFSNNVNGVVVTSADQFAAITKHLNGSKNFATSSESTKIYVKAVSTTNEGTATFEITLSNSDTADFANWSPL